MIDSSSTEDAGESVLRQLMVAYQKGDLAAFEQIYFLLADDLRRYFAKAHRDRAAIDDLVQDLFLEMHRSRRTYTPPLPVRPWIFGIARNVSLRGRRAAQQASAAHDVDAALAVVAPSRGAPSADSLDVEKALQALHASTRRPWLLHHVVGLDFQAIAARLGLTVMATKLRSSRATRALRLALDGEGRHGDE